MSGASDDRERVEPPSARGPGALELPERAPLLRVRGLGVSYSNEQFERGGARTPVLADVELELDAGDALAVVGESGAGKSTLLAAILGLLPRGARVDGGSVRFRGQELVGARAKKHAER